MVVHETGRPSYKLSSWWRISKHLMITLICDALLSHNVGEWCKVGVWMCFRIIEQYVLLMTIMPQRCALVTYSSTLHEERIIWTHWALDMYYIQTLKYVKNVHKIKIKPLKLHILLASRHKACTRRSMSRVSALIQDKAAHWFME